MNHWQYGPQGRGLRETCSAGTNLRPVRATSRLGLTGSPNVHKLGGQVPLPD